MCGFSTEKCLACRTTFEEGVNIKHNKAFECLYCSNYYMRKDSYKKHVKNFIGIPGFLYYFDIQNICSFEENLKYKGDLPFDAYSDFETTRASDCLFDLANNKRFTVSYVIIFAFLSYLNLDHIIIERSFGRNLSKLADVS